MFLDVELCLPAGYTTALDDETLVRLRMRLSINQGERVLAAL
jgi:hypothetical protein